MKQWRVFRTLEEHVANPVLRRLLRSRIHWPMSRWYCLIAYHDEVSDESRLVPASYSRMNDIVHVVAVRDRTVWWRQFRDGDTCTIYLDGEPFRAAGEVVTNAMKHADHVTDFLHPAPALAGPGASSEIEDEEFTSYVLVEFMLEPEETADEPTGDSTQIPVEPGRSG